jgi:hypothetical protein
MRISQGRRKEKLAACRGEGSAVGLLLAAHARLLRCAAGAVLSPALLTRVRIPRSTALARALAVQSVALDRRVCRYYRLLILCLHPRCRGSILRRC